MAVKESKADRFLETERTLVALEYAVIVTF